MDCTLCLKPERQYDAHYRYKMPALEVRADSRNKQRKTHLPNMASVAKNVFRPEAWLVKFLALHLSTDSSCSTGGADAYLTGHHGVKELQQIIFAFVRDYVLCRCGSPETLLYVEGKKKNKVCRLKCHSCGRSGRSAGQDEKMLNLFAAQPMPPTLCPMGSLDSAASGLDDVAMAAPATIDATPLELADGSSSTECLTVDGGGEVKAAQKHVTWDEAAIAEHRACAGVLYGTQKIEESTTPFLYYSESVSRGEGMMGEFVPGSGISMVSIEALQERLGVLAFAQSVGDQIRPAASTLIRPLPPPPWLLLQSRPESEEFFYFNPTTHEATWTLPVVSESNVVAHEGEPREIERAIAQAPRGGESRDNGESTSSDDDEELPLPTSKLAVAADCAADFAHRRQLAVSAAAGSRSGGEGEGIRLRTEEAGAGGGSG